MRLLEKVVDRLQEIHLNGRHKAIGITDERVDDQGTGGIAGEEQHAAVHGDHAEAHGDHDQRLELAFEAEIREHKT